MPLNMNTVGTGNGIGGQKSVSADFMFKMNDFISSRINSVDMDTFDVSLDRFYEASASTYNYNVNASYWPKCAYPLIKYNDELYVYTSHDAVQMDNSTVNKDKLYKAVLQTDGTMTFTEIIIPFVCIHYAFIFSDYLYLFCNDTYNSGSEYISSIYKYDGKTFTTVPATDPIRHITNVCQNYNSRCIGRGIRVTPITNTDSDDCIIIVGTLQYNSDSSIDNNYIAIAIWKLSKNGIITEVLNPNKIKYDYSVMTFSDSQIAYTTTNRGVIGKTLLGFCKKSNTPTNIDEFGNVCTSYEYDYETKDHIIHLGNIFVENDETTYNPKTIGVKLCRLILIMKYDSKTDKYSYQITLTDNTLLQNFKDSYSIRYNENKSTWFPLSYKKPDTFIVLLHSGYYADYGQGTVSTTPTTLKIWLVKIQSDDIIFKPLKFDHNEYELFSGYSVGKYTVSEYSLLDFDYHIPAFHIFSSYYNSGQRDYIYKILKMNTSSMKYSSDDSRYTISMYLNAGDTCSCNSGIVNVDHNNSTISVNSTKYVIPQNGKYKFTCKVHDAYRRPGFIVQSKDGCILNLRIKYDSANSCVTGYFQKGMTVNGVKIQDDGYTSVRVDSPRINVKM